MSVILISLTHLFISILSLYSFLLDISVKNIIKSTLASHIFQYIFCVSRLSTQVPDWNSIYPFIFSHFLCVTGVCGNLPAIKTMLDDLPLFKQHCDNINKIAYEPSLDTDQPRHLPSLMRVFAGSLKKVNIL